MNRIIFGDIHFYKNKEKSRPTGDKYSTSWLKMQCDVLEQIMEYGKSNNVECIDFNGDLFEEKNRLPQDLYNLIWDLFNKYSCWFPINFNTGNHDYIALNRYGALHPFNKLVNVISEPTIIEDTTSTEKVAIFVFPHGTYTNDAFTIHKFDKFIAYTHEEIKDFIDFKSDKAFSVEDFSDWDYVFNSHIHTPGEVKNIINIGSPYITDWKEPDTQRRFIHLYSDEDGNIRVKSVPLKYPKFKHVSTVCDQIKKKIAKDDFNFYRIDITPEEIGDPIFDKFNVTYKVVSGRKRERRLEETTSEKEELTKYIEMQDTDLDSDKLLNTGIELCQQM